MKQLTTSELNSVSGGFFREAWDKVKEAFGGSKDKSPAEKAKDACKLIGAVDKRTSMPNRGKDICTQGVETIDKYNKRREKYLNDNT